MGTSPIPKLIGVNISTMIKGKCCHCGSREVHDPLPYLSPKPSIRYFTRKNKNFIFLK
jgi:hypothetical protein